MERGTELASIRQLRDITSLGYIDAKLVLCKYYAQGKFGGISQHQAAMFVKDLVQTTSPTNTQDCFLTSRELTPSMRFVSYEIIGIVFTCILSKIVLGSFLTK